MLRAVPKRWYSWHFAVLEGARALAQINVSWWREKGVLTVEGVDYRVYREGMVSGDFIMKSADGVLARAEKPSAFWRTFVVKHDGRSYTLRAKSAFRRAFVLLEGSREVGSLVPSGLCTRKAAVNLPDHLPLPVKVFIIWLAVILWKRDSGNGGG